MSGADVAWCVGMALLVGWMARGAYEARKRYVAAKREAEERDILWPGDGR